MKALLLLFCFTFFSSTLRAELYCESFGHSEIKSSYRANFLDKNFRGCFESFFKDNAPYDSLVGGFSISIGNREVNFKNANIAKITFAAFSSIAQSQATSRKLNSDADAILQNIRNEANFNATKITQDIAQYRDTFNREALPLIKENSRLIKAETQTVNFKVENLKKISASLGQPAPAVNSTDIVLQKPAKDVDPLKREKERWSVLKNGQAVPFHTIGKILQKNPELGNKILDEVKAARYIQSGVLKPTPLPLLNEVAKYESKAIGFDTKYQYARKNLSKQDEYFEQKNFVLSASRELKTISDKKLVQGDFEKANESLDMATVALEIATSLPVAATGRGLYEFFSGKSLLTGKELSQFERGVSLSMAILDLTPTAWIAKGFKGVWAVGELGARLAERGLVKAGFEESLEFGARYAGEITQSLGELVSTGAVKLETAKRVLEHKMFFNYLSEETYLATKTFQKDIIQFEKTLTEISLSTEKYGWNQLEKDALVDVYTKAPNAKYETDKIADEIAYSLNGKVAKAPLKSPGRAVEKITNDYAKDATKIKDVVRNTIITEEKNIGTAVSALEQKGAQIKIVNASTDKLGYSGVNANILTQEGLIAEIQVNSPEMIYAKEQESIARILLGDETYNAIAAKVNIPGGKGHEFYEQWRSLPLNSPESLEIEKLSREYYDAIRGAR